MTALLFAVGLVLLVVGAEALVRGASRLALAFGISPLVIGLTVVAFGTSAPELAVSVTSSLGGAADVAVGNVVGSNIFNVLFILGLSALIVPLAVAQQLVRLDVPLMIAASLLLVLFGRNGQVSQGEGVVLFLGIVSYTVFLIRQSRREGKPVAGEPVGTGDPVAEDPVAREYQETFGEGAPKRSRQWVLDIGLVLGGLALLVLGGRWLVDGAVTFARLLGVSELVIGLTIVAAGTSLPEVATSIVAAVRGERDIAVGNVVGSNLFNILCVLGLASAVTPGGLPVSAGALRFDIPVMVAVAVACLPIFLTGHVIARWEGGLFLGYYLAYVLYLVLVATGHELLGPFRAAML
ncbi:MAG TPA: calcium/sodium antiporter, partial [Thermoanaerobaculia bacterium]|nr:calcium/sodium antiporter [Thermoanaerobaculia bacterium]